MPFALFVVAFFLLFLKSPDALTYPQFWAEDGAVFFKQQLGEVLPQVFVPYAGYLHVGPRLIAWLASHFSYSVSPLIYNISALCIDAACITHAALWASRIFGLYVVLIAFFVIPTAGDIFGSITNIQWFLQFFLVLALLAPNRPNFRTAKLANKLIYIPVIIVALSGPFSTLLAAFSIAIYMLRRMKRSGINILETRTFSVITDASAYLWSIFRKDILVVIFIGAAIQVVTMLSNEVRTPEASMALSLEQIKQLGLFFWPEHPYVSIVNRLLTPLHVLLLVVLATTTVSCLISAYKRPSPYIFLCGFLLIFGAIQPVMAYAKQQAYHTLAATSHYFYFWGVISFFIIGKFFASHVSPMRIPLFFVCVAIYIYTASIKPNYFRRAPLPNLNWENYAQRIQAGEKNVFVPLSPFSWHFVANPDNGYGNEHR